MVTSNAESSVALRGARRGQPRNPLGSLRRSLLANLGLVGLLAFGGCAEDPAEDSGRDVDVDGVDAGDVGGFDAGADAADGDAGGADSGAGDVGGDDADGSDNGGSDAFADATEDATPTLTSVSGVAQKGPLIAGSALTLQVLDDTLTQTGVSFSADIQNDDGYFTLGDVDLGGNPFLEIFADGYYYNEVTDEISNDRLSLFTLADTSSSDININVLSHLERPRTRYLYTNPEEITALNPEGELTGEDVRAAFGDAEIFDAAKLQAQGEVLAAFEVDASSLELGVSESFDIASGSTGDQILTAVSVILQSYRSVGEMTELLANLSEDLVEDGVVDDQDLLNALYTGIYFVNTEDVTENLLGRFDSLDEESASAWVAYVEEFLANTDGVLDGGPEIPDASPVIYAFVDSERLYSDQPNVLRPDATCIADSGYFGFAADVPDGFSLMVTVTVTDGLVSWHARGDESGWDAIGGDVHITPDPTEVPTASSNNVGASQSFVTDLASDEHALEFRFSGLGTVEMAYYANGLSGAYFTKTVTVMSCSDTFNLEIEPENPEDSPETIEVSVCDYSDSSASCDDPVERFETPEIEGGR
jgi:hypothetical protein